MTAIDFKCMGCGIQVQSNYPDQAGYIPETKINQTEQLLCQRCYRIRHYNEVIHVEQQAADFESVFAEIAHTQCLVVQMIDLFDFNGSIIAGIHRHIGHNPLYLLANKIDLFPKSTKPSKLRTWLKKSAKEYGLNPIQIHLISAAKGWYIDDAWAEINKLRQGQDVYVIGMANVGKSTLINHLLDPKQKVTTSRYPGTTLSTIRIPLDDGRAIIDTPGLLRRDRLSEWLTPKELKVVLPNKPVKPKIYQLREQQTLFLGGLARFDYVQGQKQSFVCYVSNRLPIHRTKLANATQIAQKHIGDWLVPPYEPTRLPAWKKHRIHLSGTQNEDIVIAGLGFIRGGKGKATIDLWAPEGIHISIRSSII